MGCKEPVIVVGLLSLEASPMAKRCRFSAMELASDDDDNPKTITDSLQPIVNCREITIEIIYWSIGYCKILLSFDWAVLLIL